MGWSPSSRSRQEDPPTAGGESGEDFPSTQTGLYEANPGPRRPLDPLDLETRQGEASPTRPAAPNAGRSTPAAWSKPIGRRTMLSILGLGALGIVFGARVQSVISNLLRSTGGGLAAALPGGGEFVVYTVTGGYPAPPPHYELAVDGLVKRPLSLTVGDLESLPPTRITGNFQCVTGWSVEHVRWTGVRLVDLADHAGASQSASGFELRSFDGIYTESLTIEQARQSGAIVAYSMLGAPITREHGGPVRLYVPEMFGYKSIKWLSKITLVDHLKPGFWEVRGYPINAWIQGHPPGRPA